MSKQKSIFITSVSNFRAIIPDCYGHAYSLCSAR